LDFFWRFYYKDAAPTALLAAARNFLVAAKTKLFDRPKYGAFDLGE
jgi:hypothetical protein